MTPETGADESFSHPAPQVLWDNGVRLLFVYPGGSDPRKAVSKAYWDACVAQGLGLVLVDEHGNNQMATGGPGFGTFIANEIIDYYEQVLRMATAGAAAYFVFADPRPALLSEYPAIVARAREICAVCLARGWVKPGDTVGSSLVGGYGDGPLLEHLYSLGLLAHRVTPTGREYGYLWPVGTWGPSPHAAFWQDPNTRMSTLGGAIDRNYLAADVVDIGQYPAAPDQGGIVGAQEVQQVTDAVKAMTAAMIAETTGERFVLFQAAVVAPPADRPDITAGALATCASDGRYFWWIEDPATLTADDSVWPELGIKAVPHVDQGAVTVDHRGVPIGFGVPLPGSRTAALLGIG
jgi:hypothetical protein